MNRVEEFIMYSLRREATPTPSGRSAADITTAFNAMLTVDISDDHTLEFPACLSYYVKSHRECCSKLIYPLTSWPVATPRRAIRGILSDCMSRNCFYRGVHFGKTLSGDYYYGLPGIIFNADKDILMMTTLEVDITGSDTYLIKRAVCRVSPKVFESPNKLVEKSIIKKMIPFCSTKVIQEGDIISNPLFSSYCNSIVGTTFKVVIDDCSNYVARPMVPKPNGDFNDALNKVLKDNVKEILNDCQ